MKVMKSDPVEFTYYEEISFSPDSGISGDMSGVPYSKISDSEVSTGEAQNNHLDYCLTQSKPRSVHRRNERERNRVKMVNMGFETLRLRIPHGTKAKKMSKVETLRAAVRYITQLKQLLAECESHEKLQTGGDYHR